MFLLGTTRVNAGVGVGEIRVFQSWTYWHMVGQRKRNARHTTYNVKYYSLL